MGIHRRTTCPLLILVSLGCAYSDPIVRSRSADHEPVLIRVVSDDPFLISAVCSDGHLICREESPDELEIELSVQNTSSDWLRNNLISLGTLTFGMIVSHSADVRISMILRERGSVVTERYRSGRVRIGYRAILPPYAGFVATNLGTALNDYRDPVHLRRFCLESEPDGVRSLLEGNRERHCKEYADFVRVAWAVASGWE